MKRLLPPVLLLPLLLTSWLLARPALGAEVMYLANEGVLVRDGETSIAFDPLFRYRSDYYQMVPLALERAMLLGTAPFEDLDAVFVSHHHGDHFAANLILRLLEARESVQLFAPAQAVMDLARLEPPESVMARVHNVELGEGEAPWRFERAGLAVAAVRIPHAGWPNRRLDIQNLAFRVTLADRTTVLHLGDADPRTLHFSLFETLWEDGATTLAMPPYWFFLSEEGRLVINGILRPQRAVGVHIPADPAERPSALEAYEVFTEPGERLLLNQEPAPN